MNDPIKMKFLYDFILQKEDNIKSFCKYLTEKDKEKNPNRENPLAFVSYSICKNPYNDEVIIINFEYWFNNVSIQSASKILSRKFFGFHSIDGINAYLNVTDSGLENDMLAFIKFITRNKNLLNLEDDL